MKVVGMVNRSAARVVSLVDKRPPAVAGLVRGRGRQFPNHWSRLFGHVAVVSFVLIVVSGVFLTVWFEPSMDRVTYTGDYGPLHGIEMSEAFASTLDLSFGVRGGLLMRQVHYWATMVFIAALSVHILCIFFTGAFRRPRRLNWLIVLALLMLGMVAAYTGHALPDDMLSGTGLRVAEGVILAIPVVGTYVSWLLFGGTFPGDDIISGLNTVHVLVLPAIMIALFVARVIHARRQRTPPVVEGDAPVKRGRRIRTTTFPDYPVKAGGLMLIVFGVIVLMAATIQINPVWLWGPFDTAQAAAGSQPPWYFGFLDGGLRLMPAWDIDLFGHELNLSVLVPAIVVPGLMLMVTAAYPWFESIATRHIPDPRSLDRPRDMPVRTGLGVGFIAFYLVLWIAGGNDIIATVMNVPLNWITRFLQVSLIVLPPLVFWVTKRICLGLQIRERDRQWNGRESGVVTVGTNGAFHERHTPLPSSDIDQLTSSDQPIPFEPSPPADANGVANPNYRAERLRARLSRFYFADVVRTSTAPEIEKNGPTGSDHHEVLR